MSQHRLSLDELRQHLQWAIELEHATIPPYLCALYSIKPGHNREAVGVITSVFVEEMLHMTLAANVLNAIGGAPVLDSPSFLPQYPTFLPHSARAFSVGLAPFTPAAVETFMKIEKPQAPDALPEDERFHTIGQFYTAIVESLKALCAELGETAVFSGNRARQVTPEMLDYRGSGRVIAAYDLPTALAALNEIEQQGEGLKHAEVWDGDRDMFHPEREEVAHYFRFLEIREGRSYRRGDTPTSGPSGTPFAVDWTAVYPMRENPRSDDYPSGTPVRQAMHAFNVLYSDTLRALHRAFNGEPDHMFSAVGAMMELKTLAQALMQMPSGDGRTTAGPSFEYVPAVNPEYDSTPMSITVRKDGPYHVEGGVPLTRKSIVYSPLHEPMSWRKDAVLEAEPSYRLCRCGQSAHKPYCDGTHDTVAFDGTETATPEPTAERQRRFRGKNVTMTDDRELCSRAGFCGNRVEKVWDLIRETQDTRVLFQLIQMVERCPSGRLGYELPELGVIEPDLPTGIAVTKDGPYWVTNSVPVKLSDGRMLEVRNRVALCRCGKSNNKPLCDGSHYEAKFRDG